MWETLPLTKRMEYSRKWWVLLASNSIPEAEVVQPGGNRKHFPWSFFPSVLTPLLHPTFLTPAAIPGERALSVRRDPGQPHTLNVKAPPIQGPADVNNLRD